MLQKYSDFWIKSLIWIIQIYSVIKLYRVMINNGWFHHLRTTVYRTSLITVNATTNYFHSVSYWALPSRLLKDWYNFSKMVLCTRIYSQVMCLFLLIMIEKSLNWQITMGQKLVTASIRFCRCNRLSVSRAVDIQFKATYGSWVFCCFNY